MGEPNTGRRRRMGGGLATLAAVALLTSGCGSSTKAAASPNAQVHGVLRLGYFPNLTHASAIVGLDKGLFAKRLGSGVTLKPSSFNAGPAAVEALFSGALDATFIGPGPTVNAFAKSHGAAIRVISGATSGGAALVVKKSITSVAQLRGAKLATPQQGNTQDVALRFWLKQHHFTTDLQGGGDVHILPQDNGSTLTAFASGALDGAWVPEPYATRLVGDGGHVLVDERTLWPGGQFETTNLVVRTAFLKSHADLVKRLLAGLVDATEYVKAHPAEAQQSVNAVIARITGKALKPATLAKAWGNLTFSVDPLANSVRTGADHAVADGLIKKPDLGNLYDLKLLNEVLKTAGKPTVSS